jgi:hypothetical protein
MVDCVEFLLHVCLIHSPLGWPSLERLLEVRKHLESQMPAGSVWPDYWISEEEFAGLPLFLDTDGYEKSLAEEHAPNVTEYSEFDRSGEQLRWVCRVLQRFQAPPRAWQAWELEAAWHDYEVRIAEDFDRCAEMLDDGQRSTSSGSPRHADEGMASLLMPTQSNEGLAGNSPEGSLDGEQSRKPRAPRPVAPTRREGPAGAVSVRQLLSYFCQGAAPEDSLARVAAVMGSKVPPMAGQAVGASAADIHAALLQLGARPTPASLEGDGRPSYPSLEQLREELELASADGTGGTRLSMEELAGNSKVRSLLARFGLEKRHCRAQQQLEQLFPKKPVGMRPSRVPSEQSSSAA